MSPTTNNDSTSITLVATCQNANGRKVTFVGCACPPCVDAMSAVLSASNFAIDRGTMCLLITHYDCSPCGLALIHRNSVDACLWCSTSACSTSWHLMSH